MKKARVSLPLFLFLLVGLVCVQTAVAEPYGLQNVWALGIDNASGCPGDIGSDWAHSATVSLSRCPKNPAPDGGPGAAFKNGPVSGGGQSGVETTSSQLFTLPYAETHQLTFSMLAVCVRCDYIIVELYGGGELLGTLLTVDDSGAGGVDTGEGWPRYSGSVLAVPHYSEYELVIRSLWTESNSLGAKWTGLQLDDVPSAGTVTPTATETPTAVPTNTATPAPTATPTATPEPLPLAPGQYAIICQGDLTLAGNVLTCEVAN